MKRKQAVGIIILSGFLLGGAWACGSAEEKGQVSAENSTDAQEDAGIGWLDLENYKERMSEKRVPISDAREGHAEEEQQIRNTEYENISFSNAEFEIFPECEEVSLLWQQTLVMTPQESWNYIEKQLEEIGKLDQVDMEKEVRVVTPELEWDDTKDAPYCYPALAEHMDDITDAGGAYVDVKDCYVMAAGRLADGKITAYLGADEHAEKEVYYDSYAKDVETSGSLSELGDRSWPLISGEITVRQGADLVMDYFDGSGLTQPAEGVSLEVANVEVFHLKEVFGYYYQLRRIYNGLPVAFSKDASYQPLDTSYLAMEDCKDVFVADDTGVCAFSGTSERDTLTELYTDEKILGAADAAELLSGKLASGVRMDVENVSLVYEPLVEISEDADMALFPCWRFAGENLVKDEELMVCVDAFTGDIYCYSVPEWQQHD